MSGGFQQDAFPLRNPPSGRWFAPGGEGCGQPAASSDPAPLAGSTAAGSRESGDGCSPRRDADLSSAKVRSATRRRCGPRQGRGCIFRVWHWWNSPQGGGAVCRRRGRRSSRPPELNASREGALHLPASKSYSCRASSFLDLGQRPAWRRRR
jgi:hypothetical protein